jgi:plasmid stability protein
MPTLQRQDVRTTLTLDEDLAAKLRDEARKTGRSFKETVNACLRAGLSLRKPMQKARPFRVRPHDMGLQPGVNFDKVSTLLDEIEGAEHK